jgi:hypothetical protein
VPCITCCTVQHKTAKEACNFGDVDVAAHLSRGGSCKLCIECVCMQVLHALAVADSRALCGGLCAKSYVSWCCCGP